MKSKFFIKSVILCISCFNLFSLCGITQNQLKSIPNNLNLRLKASLDTSMFGKWAELGRNIKLSNDGKYVAYTIDYPASKKSMLFLRAVNNLRERELSEITETEPFYFSKDSKQFIFRHKDSLMFLKINKGTIMSNGPIESWKYFNSNGGEWLAYLSRGENKLVVKNVSSEYEMNYLHVIDYHFDPEGNSLLVQSVNNGINRLEWINLQQRKSKIIWVNKCSDSSPQLIGNVVFDETGEQCAFAFNVKDDVAIWYYQKGMDSAVLKVNKESAGIAKNMEISALRGFSKNGKYLFFDLQEKRNDLIPTSTLAPVNIWSYKDLVIQPQQRNNLKKKITFLSVFSIVDQSVRQLQAANDMAVHYLHHINGDYLIMTDDDRNNTPFWWPHRIKPSTYSISLKDGSKRHICTGSKWGDYSPTGKYFVYWDYDSLAFMSYDLNNGKNVNITRCIPEKLSEDFVRGPESLPISNAITWSENDEYVIFYDKYDIWKVSPVGKSPAVNLTNGFGRKNKIVLRLVYANDRQGGYDIYDSKEILLLTGVSEVTKDNGFFKCDGIHDPKMLTMGPYVYYKDVSHNLSGGASYGMQPIKAMNAEGWVVRRESAKDYPNYYITKDFKTFTNITNLDPLKEVKWLTTELISWKMPDGKMNQGILYKPDDFDPQIKYPIIFEFYETRTERLNDFLKPYYSAGEINIPWFLSQGYLVFSPDIQYEIASRTGRTFGECAYNSVVSAAHSLSKLRYINNKKMAIHGASFGGAQASYLVTHTNIFAAASEAFGYTDPISFYLQLSPRHPKQQFPKGELTGASQGGRARFGASLWERPDLYLKNSSVLSANKATAPLLIMHNPLDDVVGMEQGIELYIAFRRLGKKCWMLEYDNGGHGVNGNDAIDYNIRLSQFFDHYLKEQPPALWMTKGIPAIVKGKSNGFELDQEGSCGVDCNICKEKLYNTTKK